MYMSCSHKFQNELDLGLIDYQPVTLIVGTFIPSWPVDNKEEWFYGRTGVNYFWNVLPRLYGEASLLNASPAEWKQFCQSKQIALTDIISSIDDAETGNREHNKILAGNADDALAFNFDDFTFVSIVRILQRQPTIKSVYFTRGVTEAFWRHLWNPVMQYCDLHHLHERKLLTPSTKSTDQHLVYNTQRPDDQVDSLEDYILMKWRHEWHF